MTGEDAERLVEREWGDVAASPFGLGCAVRVEPSMTEEHGWGWVVCLVPVRWEECRQPCKVDRYAATRAGKTYPVGTKGLGHALSRLGVPLGERGGE
ncbi:hypothetical protein [Gemmata sp.]|uniref:hypothetical protein n=1 Tax=Gemmata sp. TaxID=1914242 RepID=UPI003F721B31